MKEIKLTQGKVALVDDEDFDMLNQYTWYGDKYAQTTIERKSVQMHRLIMKTPRWMVVDHIDHNGLNNQKSNLRNCSQSANCKNKINSHFPSPGRGKFIVDIQGLIDEWNLKNENKINRRILAHEMMLKGIYTSEISGLNMMGYIERKKANKISVQLLQFLCDRFDKTYNEIIWK